MVLLPQENLMRSTVLLSQRGTVLYVSPDQQRRTEILNLLKAASVCSVRPPSLGTECKCPDCLVTLDGGRHPKIQEILTSTFDEQMVSVYAYPSKVICIDNVDLLSFERQIQLLIWLEMYSSNHSIILGASNSSRLLPTICSRAFVYTGIFKMQIPESDKIAALDVIHCLIKGELKIPDVMFWEQSLELALAMQHALVEDLEKRFSGIQKRIGLSNSEAFHLLKLLGRYLESPKTHNLSLLLKSYQMLALQNVR